MLLTLGVSLAGLYISYRMATALQGVQKKVESVAGTGTALGDLGAALGW